MTAASVRAPQILPSFGVFCLSCALLACGSSKNGNTGGTGGTGGTGTAQLDLSKVVFIGDSLTAGFQNGSLIDTHQPSGYAALIATQAKFPITLPLIAPPGAPNVLELKSVGPPPVIDSVSGTSTGRDDTSQQPTDLAVPGHKLNDLINAAPTALPTTGEDIITNLVLGFPVGNKNTQLQQAIALQPTTLFVWIGNDDLLGANNDGVPSSITSLAAFSGQYAQMMTTLHTGLPNTTLIVANLPDVTTIPSLTPAALVLSEASTQSGIPVAQLSPVLGIQPQSSTYGGDLVNASGLKQVQSILDALAQGKQAGPVDTSGFLSAAEVVQVQQQVTAFNQEIEKETTAVGGVLVDTHAFFANLQNGMTINNYKATPAFLGGFFSLDGTHPTNTGYALLANAFIDTINAARKTSIPDVNVSTVAAADPLFGPNIKPGAQAVHIPTNAAAALDWMFHRTGKKGTASQPR